MADFYTTTGNNFTTANSGDIREAMKTMQQFMSKDAVRKSRAYFDMLGSKCNACGESIDYLEEPERIVVCKCVFAQLQKLSVPADQADRLSPLLGIRIDVK